MQRFRPLLAASLVGLVLTAASGCGNQDTSGYKTYTPPTESTGDTDTDPGVVLEEPALAVTQQPDSAADLSSSDPLTDEPEVGDESRDQPEPEITTDPAVVPATAVSEAPVEASADPQVIADPPLPSREALLASIGASDIAAVPIEPRETRLLIPEKSFRRERDALRVSYDDIDLLKVLNMEPVTPDAPDHFPAWLKDLEGERIRIRGYMRPGELAENLPFFVLARDTQACCFGPNTKAYDIIPVIMREGVTTDYIHLRPFDLVGNFHINVEMDFADPDKVEYLYYIDDAVLIDD